MNLKNIKTLSCLKVKKLSKFQHFFLFKLRLSSLLIVVTSSSVNMQSLKDVHMC